MDGSVYVVQVKQAAFDRFQSQIVLHNNSQQKLITFFRRKIVDVDTMLKKLSVVYRNFIRQVASNDH